MGLVERGIHGKPFCFTLCCFPCETTPSMWVCLKIGKHIPKWICLKGSVFIISCGCPFSCWCSGNEKWNDPYKPTIVWIPLVRNPTVHSMSHPPLVSFEGISRFSQHASLFPLLHTIPTGSPVEAPRSWSWAASERWAASRKKMLGGRESEPSGTLPPAIRWKCTDTRRKKLLSSWKVPFVLPC